MREQWHIDGLTKAQLQDVTDWCFGQFTAMGVFMPVQGAELHDFVHEDESSWAVTGGSLVQRERKRKAYSIFSFAELNAITPADKKSQHNHKTSLRRSSDWCVQYSVLSSSSSSSLVFVVVVVVPLFVACLLVIVYGQ